MFYATAMKRDLVRDHPETVPPDHRDDTQDSLHNGPETSSLGAKEEGCNVPWDRMTVSEAADALKVTQSAIRKRIQRGTIPWDKDVEGRVYVYVAPSEASPETGGDESHDEVSGSSRDELVTELRNQVSFLRAELERKDTILMSLMHRIPQLEAPSEPKKSFERSTEDNGGKAAPESTVELKEPAKRRSWIARFFLGS